MSVEYRAALPFPWFGHTYQPGDLIDVTGYDVHTLRELLKQPVYASVPVVETVNAVPAAGAAQTIPEPTVATISRLVLSAASCALTFPALGAGKSFRVALVQDGTGGRLVTWPGTVKWPGGTTPTLTAAINKTDVFTFLCVDGANWLGAAAGQNF